MQVKFFTVLCVLFVGLRSQAFILFEPFAAYESGAVKCTDINDQVCDHNTTGVNYGARLGYHMMNPLWFAVEYTGANPVAKYNTVGTSDDKITRTIMGAVFGYDTGNFRFWLGYGFSNEAKYVDTATSPVADRSFKAGTSTKAGLGFLVHKRVSLNLEYAIDTYTKAESNAVTTELSTSFKTLSPSRVVFSISMPWLMGGR